MSDSIRAGWKVVTALAFVAGLLWTAAGRLFDAGRFYQEKTALLGAILNKATDIETQQAKQNALVLEQIRQHETRLDTIESWEVRHEADNRWVEQRVTLHDSRLDRLEDRRR